MNNRTTNQSTVTSSCRYYMFHRQDMHKMLMDTATQEQGTGTPVKLVVNHKVLQNHIFTHLTRSLHIISSEADC